MSSIPSSPSSLNGSNNSLQAFTLSQNPNTAQSSSSSANSFSSTVLVRLSSDTLTNQLLPILQSDISKLEQEEKNFGKNVQDLTKNLDQAKRELQEKQKQVTDLEITLEKAQKAYQDTRGDLQKGQAELASLQFQLKNSGPPTLNKRNLSSEESQAASSSSIQKKARLSGYAKKTEALPIMGEIYKPGTPVFYKSQKGEIISYDSKGKIFEVKLSSDGSTVFGDIETLLFYPEVGKRYLVKETSKMDKNQRYYEAEIEEVQYLPVPSSRLQIKVHWTQYQRKEILNISKLTGILPFDKEDPWAEKLSWQIVKSQDDPPLVGRGYWLIFNKNLKPSLH